MSRRTNESLLDHTFAVSNERGDYDVIHIPGCAPPVLARKITPKRRPHVRRTLIVCGCIGAAVLLMLGGGVWAFAWSAF